MKWTLLFLFLLANLGCAKKDPSILPTESLVIAAQAMRSNGGYVSCYVEFYKRDQPGVIYPLEQDSVVACDGLKASVSNQGFWVSLYHPGSEPVRITVVRPKAGATTVNYAVPQ